MKNVAIYCRLSKEDITKDTDKKEESESIQNQKLLLQEYALEKGWHIFSIYVDDDYSGLDNARPSFCRMIEDAKQGRFQIIICKSQSRFTRDMQVVEQYLHDLFPLWGIRFIGVVDGVDTGLEGNKKARQITGLVNEWYCEDLSENIRCVFREKMEKGQFLAPFAPYGYQKNPLNSHQLVPDPEAAKIVKKIFDYYIKGMGVQQIRDQLSEEKIPTPSVYKKRKGLSYYHPNSELYGDSYGLWANSTIRKILKNPVYIGDVVQGTQRKVSYKRKKVIKTPEKDWIIVPNCHEKIIDPETFTLVQERLTQRSNGKHSRINKEHLLLPTSMIRCEACGKNMNRTRGKNGAIYFYCPLATRSKGTLCIPRSILARDLLQIIWGNCILRGKSILLKWGNYGSSEQQKIFKFIEENPENLERVQDISDFGQDEYELVNRLITYIEIGEKKKKIQKVRINWRY